MSECICSSCKNLKGIIGEQGEVEEYECKFGFPSNKCEECEGEECSETCSNYLSDEAEDIKVTVNCKGCGKAIEKVFSDGGNNDEVFCINCYLSNLSK